MPIHNELPPPATESGAAKAAIRSNEQLTLAFFIAGWGVLIGLHCIGFLLLTHRGILGYIHEIAAHWMLFRAHRWLQWILVIGLTATYVAFRSLRNGQRRQTVILPPYDPYPDYAYSDDIVIGYGHTRRGKVPGDQFDGMDDDDEWETSDYGILTALGSFGNVQCTGVPGSGKSTGFIDPYLDQAIAKYPKPLRPEQFSLGSDGRYPKALQLPGYAHLRRYAQTRLQYLGCLFGVRFGPFVTRPLPPTRNAPYGGMTPAEAKAEYTKLLTIHNEKRWGVFFLDYKGDQTERIRRMAILHGREADLRILEPGGEHTHNILDPSMDAGKQAAAFLEAHHAVKRDPGHAFWNDVMYQWLTHAIRLLQAVAPDELRIPMLKRMIEDPKSIEHLLTEATEHHRKEVGGMTPVGAVHPIDLKSAIDFFTYFDKLDKRHRDQVLVGVSAHCELFNPAQIAAIFAPQMPPTFAGFDDMIKQGLIVGIRVPVGKHGKLSTAIGIHILAEVQHAVLRRRESPDFTPESRVIAIVIDEMARYLNHLTNEFLAENRQSRAIFVAAHQTHDQVDAFDIAAGREFINQTQTKIAFRSPHGVAALRESAIFGTRRVYVSKFGESIGFSRARRKSRSNSVFSNLWRRQAGVDLTHNLTSTGSTQIEDTERAWFDAADFEQLDVFECLVKVFDGTTGHPPRKLYTTPYYESPNGRALSTVTLLPPRDPHPIALVMTERSRDDRLLKTVISQAGFMIVEPLLDKTEVLAGFKFTNPSGTVIASRAVVDRCAKVFVQRFGNPSERRTLAFTDMAVGATYFAHAFGGGFVQVLDLVEVLRQSGTAEHHHGQALTGTTAASGHVANYWTIFAASAQRPLSYSPIGAWEYHLDLAKHQSSIIKDGRTVLELYRQAIRTLTVEGDIPLQACYGSAQRTLSRLLGEDTSEHTSATPAASSGSLPLPTSFSVPSPLKEPSAHETDTSSDSSPGQATPVDRTVQRRSKRRRPAGGRNTGPDWSGSGDVSPPRADES